MIFVHYGYFYSASSSPLLLRDAPDYSIDTVGVNKPKHYRQLRVKDLPKVPTWRLEWDSNLRPSGRKALNPTTEPTRPTVPRHEGNRKPVINTWCMANKMATPLDSSWPGRHSIIGSHAKCLQYKCCKRMVSASGGRDDINEHTRLFPRPHAPPPADKARREMSRSPLRLPRDQLAS